MTASDYRLAAAALVSQADMVRCGGDTETAHKMEHVAALCLVEAEHADAAGPGDQEN